MAVPAEHHTWMRMRQRSDKAACYFSFCILQVQSLALEYQGLCKPSTSSGATSDTTNSGGGFCTYHGSGTLRDGIPTSQAVGMRFGIPQPYQTSADSYVVYQQLQAYQRHPALSLVYHEPHSDWYTRRGQLVYTSHFWYFIGTL